MPVGRHARPAEEGEVRLRALLTWAQPELVRLCGSILRAVPECLLPPCALQ